MKKARAAVLIVGAMLAIGWHADPQARPAGNEPLVIAEVEFRLGPPDGSFAKWKDTRAKLPTLKEMGANAIFLWAPYQASPERARYTMPAWTEEEGKPKEIELDMRNHGWCVPNLYATDFLTPDPRRGSKEEFLELIREAHRLGLKVMGQIVVTGSYPGDFIHDRHPEWLLKTRIAGKEYPAVFWPWAPHYSWGYVINKAHPGLIAYVTETVIPHWIKEWGFDGVFLDSPGMLYCPARVKSLCQSPIKGAEYLTPVEGDYAPDALCRAIREKIEALKKELRRDLSFSGEGTPRAVTDFSDELLKKLCNQGTFGPHWALPVDHSLGKHFDFVWDYQHAAVMRSLLTGPQSVYSTSRGYAALFREQRQGEAQFTSLARFVSLVNTLHQPGNWVTVRPQWVGPFVVLSVTAPGNIVWIGHRLWEVEYRTMWCAYFLEKYGVQYTPSNLLETCKSQVLNPDITRAWYRKTIKIKQAHPSLQGDNIEDALLSPESSGLIAYNRWNNDAGDIVTVVANTTARDTVCRIKTRFGKNALLRDLLSGARVDGEPENLRVSVPAYSAVILAKAN